jgi:hypothetical protein
MDKKSLHNGNKDFFEYWKLQGEPQISPSDWAQLSSLMEKAGQGYTCVCAHAHVRAIVCACVCGVIVHVCARVWLCTAHVHVIVCVWAHACIVGSSVEWFADTQNLNFLNTDYDYPYQFGEIHKIEHDHCF